MAYFSDTQPTACKSKWWHVYKCC